MKMWKRSNGLIEFICKHKVGHPIQQSVEELERRGLKGFELHGCMEQCMNGNCHPKTFVEARKLIKEEREE